MSDLALTRPGSLMTLVDRRPLLPVSRLYSLTADLRRRNQPLVTIQPRLALVQRTSIFTPAQPSRSTGSWRPSPMIWYGRPDTATTETPLAEAGTDWDWTPGPGAPVTESIMEDTVLQRSETGPAPLQPPSAPRVIAQRPAPPGYPAEPQPAPAGYPSASLEEEPTEEASAATGLVRGSDLWRRMFPERPRLRDVIQAREAVRQRRAATRAAPPTIPENLPRTRTWEISSTQPGQTVATRAPASSGPSIADEPVESSAPPSGEGPVDLEEERLEEQAPSMQPPLPPADELLPSGRIDQELALPAPTAAVSGSDVVGREPRRPAPRPGGAVTELPVRPGPTPPHSEPVQARPVDGTVEDTAAQQTVQEIESDVELRGSRLPLGQTTTGDSPAEEPPTLPSMTTDVAPAEFTSGPSTVVPVSPPAQPVAEPPLPAGRPAVTVPPLAGEGRQPSPATGEAATPASRPAVAPGQVGVAAPTALPETRPSRVSRRARGQDAGQPESVVPADHPGPVAGRPSREPSAKPRDAVQRRSRTAELGRRPPPEELSVPVQASQEPVQPLVTDSPPAAAGQSVGIRDAEVDSSLDAEPVVVQAEREAPARVEPPSPMVAPTQRPGDLQAKRARGTSRAPVTGEPAMGPPPAEAEHPSPVGRPGAELAPPEPGPIQTVSQVLAEPAPVMRGVVGSPTDRTAAEPEKARPPVRAGTVVPTIRAAEVPVPAASAAPTVVAVLGTVAEPGGKAVSTAARAESDSLPGPFRIVAPYPAARRYPAGPLAASAWIARKTVGDTAEPGSSAPVAVPLASTPVTADRKVVASASPLIGSVVPPAPPPSSPGPPAEPAASLPLRIPARPAPAPVQRVESAQAGGETQPDEATSESAAVESADAEGPDLEELARKVYPYLRRRLGVERERIGPR